MRTQPHKTHMVDDLLEEIDKLSVFLNVTHHSPLSRSDLVLVRKEILSHMYEVLSEARRRLQDAA